MDWGWGICSRLNFEPTPEPTDCKLIDLNKDCQPVTSSRMVAKVFNKEHKHVMEAIRNLGCPEEFKRSNFRPHEIIDNSGTSRMVAEVFNKEHFHVLRDIERLRQRLAHAGRDDFAASNLVFVEIIDNSGPRSAGQQVLL